MVIHLGLPDQNGGNWQAKQKAVIGFLCHRVESEAIAKTKRESEIIREPGVDVRLSSKLNERIVKFWWADEQGRTEGKFQMLATPDDPVETGIQIWNDLILTFESLVEDIMIAEAETSSSTEFDNIFDDRNPIVDHGVRLVDILVYRVPIRVLPCAVPIILCRASKVICSAQPCAPIPVTFELTVILQSHVGPDIIVRAEISTSIQINDWLIAALCMNRNGTQQSKQERNYLSFHIQIATHRCEVSNLSSNI